MIYFDLFIGFLEVGLFSFGGAYAAIPLIRDVVMAHGWLDDEMLAYMIAISESTPGPIMVNMATYIGSEKGRITWCDNCYHSGCITCFFYHFAYNGSNEEISSKPLSQGCFIWVTAMYYRNHLGNRYIYDYKKLWFCFQWQA